VKALIALLAVLILAGLPLVLTNGGSTGLRFFFGVIAPYIGMAVFLLGIIVRIISWAKSPVPFRIVTTCGQQKSLKWIKSSKLENPHTFWGAVGRMALEILCFRSLFRNTKAELREGPKLAYGADKWLWAAGLAFHWSLLIIFLRHFKYFAEPVPYFVTVIQNLDGFFQVGLPILYITDIIVIVALTYLFLRRVFIPQVKYISLPADYFALFLLLGITVSGVSVRYLFKTDIVGVKELGTGLLSFSPVVPDSIGASFFVHLFLVSCLMIYFPFSKLMHMGGVFLSPTRNLVNNSRAKRHINPWNHDVKVHTYEEYEDEFRDVMREAGLPLEKE